MNVPRVLRRLFRLPYDGLQHFGVVRPGVLYRCGQPRPAELEDLIKKHNFRTVISLRGSRGAEDPDAWEADERAVCTAYGVEFVTIPCNHKNPPTPEQAELFLSLARREDRHPILIHCRLGQQRTLLFCGLFRVHVDGLDPASAEREMDWLGFGASQRRHGRLLRTFRELARVRLGDPGGPPSR